MGVWKEEDGCGVVGVEVFLDNLKRTKRVWYFSRPRQRREVQKKGFLVHRVYRVLFTVPIVVVKEESR